MTRRPTHVAAYVADTVDYATIDRWDGRSAPLILCESRSLAGALRDLAGRYACPIASTNGQTRGFLVSKVAPALQPGQRVLYVGDFDWCGGQIEEASRRTLAEHTDVHERPWERIALTDQQVRENNLPVIAAQRCMTGPRRPNVLVWVTTLGTTNGESRTEISEITLRAAT